MVYGETPIESNIAYFLENHSGFQELEYITILFQEKDFAMHVCSQQAR